MSLALAMWLHAILNAIVCYEPIPPPREWVGELRLVPVVVSTLAVWCAVYQVQFG